MHGQQYVKIKHVRWQHVHSLDVLVIPIKGQISNVLCSYA